jgi:hypothetical protein
MIPILLSSLRPRNPVPDTCTHAFMTAFGALALAVPQWPASGRWISTRIAAVEGEDCTH